jgi:hypothetical protein
VSAAPPLDYADRCERYARQRGWAYDPARLSIHHLTPRQRRRAIKKERSAWPLYSRRSIDMPWDHRYRAHDDEVAGAERRFLRRAVADECDVCGLPDNYNGDGDGIGSCDCPRCDGGEAAAHSVFCTCPPDDIPGYYDDEPNGAGLTEARRGD